MEYLSHKDKDLIIKLFAYIYYFPMNAQKQIEQLDLHNEHSKLREFT